MLRSAVRMLMLLPAALAAPPAAHAQVGFADSEPDRIRLWNADFVELALRKSDGRVLCILDKTTGQHVSPGNVHGPWVLKFSNNTWLDGENFSPTNPGRLFSYGWSPQTSTLTVQYLATGTYACLVVLTYTIGDGPEIDTALTISNNSLFEMQLVAYPVNLAISRSHIEAVYAPYIEGMRLTPNFFASYDFTGRYPGRMFADFAYADLTSGALAVYAIQDQQAPVKPANWLILRDDAFGGGVNKIHHDYETAIGPGGQWASPTSVLSVGASLGEAMAAYWTRCGNDALPTLDQKLDPATAQKLRRAVLLKRDFLQGSWTFQSFLGALPSIPAENLLHIVSFWERGFDENYPDYLPPNPALGTLAELQQLVATARGLGHLVMPYTNPTWWDNESPSLGSLGPGVVARTRTNSLIFETYGDHGGYVVSPTSPAVIARQDQTRVEFTQTVPCDFLFEDQVGARDAPTYAANSSTSDPLRYTQGLIDVAARSAEFLPTMTEGGSDRLTWRETGFCNTLKLGWYSWPNSTFTPFPMAPLWAHRNLYFNCHNLAGQYMAVDAASLTYYVSMGYSLSYDLASADPNWLTMLDICQKQLVSTWVGAGMAAFELLATPGRTRTTFADGAVVTANLTDSTMAEGGHEIAPNGFLATRGERVVGGIVRTLHGQPLLGAAPHYVFLNHADYRIRIWKPRGSDTPVTIPRPAGWGDTARVRAAAVTTAGVRITQPAIVGGATIQFTYLGQVSGQPVRRFELSYCRLGDADCDGDIGPSDWLVLAGCLLGPDAAPGASCLDAFDADHDVDADLRDAAAFQSGFGLGS